jgi:CheY-like chemotaxis protein
LSDPPDPAPTPPPARLSRRAWEAYLRQELTAPAAALAEYARELAQQADAAGPDLAARAGRIRDRADHLRAAIQTLTDAGAEPAGPDPEHDRAVRHDLRAAAAYVVSACEDIAEDDAPAAAPLKPTVARTLAAARTVIASIEAVVRNRQHADPPSQLASDIRRMLAELGKAAVGRRPIVGRVLVVDDNEYGRDLIARMLAQQGHTVEAAGGGAEALARLADPAAPPVDLLLVDVMMPGMTGPELLGKLKTDARLWHLPVIMVSALGDEAGVLACIAAGAEDYLTRPVQPELLRARIAGCLEKKRLRDREAEYQARIDGLVRAIFPPAVVKEWEEHGAIRPRLHPRVGVLFLDVVGFTAVCERLRDTPDRVIALLQTQVEKFEATAARHGVQKIKTIGDAFLGVAGLPDPDPNPALTLLKCGLDLIADTAGHPAGWQVRVGIDVGPVVSGVLGKAQFGFDVWGHTVNAAARIEGSGRPGRVTLSDDAWQMLGGAAVGEERQIVARGIGVLTVWDFERWADGSPA